MFRIKVEFVASLGCIFALMSVTTAAVQAADYGSGPGESRTYFVAPPPPMVPRRIVRVSSPAMVGPAEYYRYPWRSPTYGEVEPYAFGSYDPYGPYIPPEAPYGYGAYVLPR
jgi:hypothetical protein